MITYKDATGLIHEEKYDNSITSIDLSFRNITQILNISGLTSLQELWLSNNQITEIKGLDGLTRLQILLLSNNQMT